MALSDTMQRRVDEVRERVDIVGVIGKVVRLGRGHKPRGCCPFHGSKSDSFVVDPAKGRAKCWGCDWSGDVIRFVMDNRGLTFLDALRELDAEGGSVGLAEGAAVAREKVARAPRAGRGDDRPRVSSLEMGRWLWARGGRELGPVRTYLAARGVPAAMLDDYRLSDVRFLAVAPIVPWAEGEDPARMPTAPAMLALIRRAPAAGESGRDHRWPAIGVHVTFLNPGFDGKMVRQRADGSDYPARKMLGDAGGGGLVLRGDGLAWRPRPLFVGEGIETVLSGMALLEASADAHGLAVLSLDNLQGGVLRRAGAIPLYDPAPDPERPAVAFAHEGPVTVLVDADMKPLLGPMDPRKGGRQGERVIEARGARIVQRAISSVERSAICGTVAVKAWRAAGCRQVRAVRPPMGQDFNDRIQEIGS